jgi:hypothetical protein
MVSPLTVKKVIDIPVSSRDVTNQTLSGREYLNYCRQGRVWLVTSRLGTGKSGTFFTVLLLNISRFASHATNICKAVLVFKGNICNADTEDYSIILSI